MPRARAKGMMRAVMQARDPAIRHGRAQDLLPPLLAFRMFGDGGRRLCRTLK